MRQAIGVSRDQHAGDAHAQRARAARRWRYRGGVSVLVLVAAFTLAAANARALIVQVGGSTVSVLPVRATSTRGSNFAKTPLEYHGGPVMPSNTNYPLYWDPSAGSQYPAGYVGGLNRYFEDLAHDSGGVQNTDSVLTQYGDTAGEAASYSSHFG